MTETSQSDLKKATSSPPKSEDIVVSKTSSDMSIDNEDGFLSAMFNMEEENQENELNTSCPGGMESLLKAPLQFDFKTPVQTQSINKPPRFRRFLSLIESPFEANQKGTPLASLDNSLNSENRALFTPVLSFANRRGDADMKESPMQEILNSNKLIPKKRKSNSVEYSSPNLTRGGKCSTLQRCRSESEATIMSAIQRSHHNPHLIGDFTKPYALPLSPGKHQDLKTISPQTLANLISNNFKDTIESYIVVDCRYPYEYEAGHIKDAVNIYTKEGILETFVRSARTSMSDLNKRKNILIFHCEFSSERGPNLYRFLRNQDRETNKDNYPSLFHPEIYLLNGGYKENHVEEYRKYHAEARSKKLNQNRSKLKSHKSIH